MDTDIESKTGFPIVVAKGNEGLTEQTYCRQFAGQLRRRQDDVPKVCEHVNVDSIQEQEWLTPRARRRVMKSAPYRCQREPRILPLTD